MKTDSSLFLKQNSDCFQTNSAAEYCPVPLMHRRRIFLTALSRCSDTCPPNTWHTEGGVGWGSAAARMLRRRVEISKSTRSRISPPVPIESLRGSELTGLGLAAGFLFSIFSPPSTSARFRNASFVHGEEQEGAQLPPAPESGGRLQQAGHHPGTHMLGSVQTHPVCTLLRQVKSAVLNVVSNLSYLAFTLARELLCLKGTFLLYFDIFYW